jgi:hypothetical protein
MLSFGIFNNKKSILITLYIIKINIIKVILRTVILVPKHKAKLNSPSQLFHVM